VVRRLGLVQDRLEELDRGMPEELVQGRQEGRVDKEEL
jgi:hypothetical protein